MVDVAVVGVGAVGGTVAGELLETNYHRVTLCVRTPFTRLRVRYYGGIERTYDTPVLVNPGDVEPVEWVLLATKVHQTQAALPWLQALCRRGTKLAVLQNGVEHRERLVPLAPQAVIVPVIVSCPAEAIRPGTVEQRGPLVLTVADDVPGRAFAELFLKSSTRVKTTAQFDTTAWMKLASNAVSGALTALTGRPMEIFANPGYTELARRMLVEVLAVGRAAGISLPDNALADMLAAERASDPQQGTSMLYDRLAGRTMELDARNGIIVRMGQLHGIATPYNEAIIRVLEAMQPT